MTSEPLTSDPLSVPSRFDISSDLLYGFPVIQIIFLPKQKLDINVKDEVFIFMDSLAAVAVCY